jgi:hypothetical protein
MTDIDKTNRIYEVIKNSKCPLHVSDIATKMGEKQRIVESRVYYLAQRGRLFKRVGPNVFDIIPKGLEDTIPPSHHVLERKITYYEIELIEVTAKAKQLKKVIRDLQKMKEKI